MNAPTAAAGDPRSAVADALNAAPKILNIELTNRCNLSCRFCDWSRLSRGMTLGSMDSALLREILAGIRPLRLHELGLVGLGEPLLDPNLEAHLGIVREVQEGFDRISLNTNGLELDARNSQILCRSALSHITVSLNAADPVTYRKLMGRSAFERVLANIRVLMRVRGDTGRDDLQVDVQVMDGAGDPAAVASRLAHERESGLRVFVRKIYSKPAVRGAGGILTPGSTGFERRHPCGSLFSRAYVDINGWLYPCTMGNDCYREGSALCLGNVQRDPLLALFNSTAVRSARARELAGETAFPECEACNIWSLLPNNFKWDASGPGWVPANGDVRLAALAPVSRGAGKGSS
jgi:sulfatase maturation enzyme AslB (radical SAM superfamily)